MGISKGVVIAVFCIWGSQVQAQNDSSAAPVPAQGTYQKLNVSELNQLLSPIALYPDALIAIILPASTVPSDVVLGARYLEANGDPELARNQPWDESVKSLVRYPDVLAWMDKNLEWTASVGEAFVEQPADVMNVVQALREQAKAAGNLHDTPQQKVVTVEKVIRIVPTDPQVIYVPQYDPELVYMQSQAPEPLLSFGIGFAVGTWLNYDFDWNRRYIYRGQWRGWDHDWNDNRAYDQNQSGNQINVVNIDINNASQWQPSASSQRQISQLQRNNGGNARFMSSRSRSVAAERQGSQQGPLSGTSQPARFNPQVQSALPRPSRMAISQGGNARNRVQPSGIAGAAAGIAPASNVQVPAPTNKISRQKGSQSLRGEQPSGRYSSSQIQRNLQQKGNVPYPTALVPNVSATGEPVRKQAQSTSKKSQSARKTAPMPRQVSQPTQPAPVINQQGTQPSQQAVPERKQAQPQRQQPQESRKAPSQQAVPERKQAQPERKQPQESRRAPSQQAVPERKQAQPQRQQPQESRKAPSQQAVPERKQAQPQRQQPQERKQAQPERKQQQKQSAPAPAKTEAKAPSGGKSKPDKNAKKNGDEKKSE